MTTILKPHEFSTLQVLWLLLRENHSYKRFVKAVTGRENLVTDENIESLLGALPQGFAEEVRSALKCGLVGREMWINQLHKQYGSTIEINLGSLPELPDTPIAADSAA